MFGKYPSCVRLRNQRVPHFHGKLALFCGVWAFACYLHGANSEPKSKASDANSAGDLLYVRREIPSERNACTEWAEAEKVFTRLNERQREIARVQSKLSEDEIVQFLDWRKTNQLAWDLIERSLNKPEAQLPKWKSLQTPPFIAMLTDVARARRVFALVAIAEGKTQDAVNLLVGNLRLATLLRDAGGPIIHHLGAHAIRVFTENAIARLTRENDTPTSVLREMLRHLPRLDDEALAYRTALCVEFTEFGLIPIDVQAPVQSWSKATQSDDVPSSLWPKELQDSLAIIHEPRLVALHPTPFDGGAQVKFYAERFRRYIKTTQGPWAKRDLKLESDIALIRNRFVEEIQPLIRAASGESLPLSEAAAQRLSPYYSRVANPVGRFWQSTEDVMPSYLRVFHARIQREAIRAVIALKIFEKERGEIPNTLSELVNVGIIAELPWDTFSGRPLRYSKKDRRIWSVGQNGKDERGKAERLGSQTGDVVWRFLDWMSRSQPFMRTFSKTYGWRSCGWARH